MGAVSNMIKEGQDGVKAMREKADILAKKINGLGGPYIEGMN